MAAFNIVWILVSYIFIYGVRNLEATSLKNGYIINNAKCKLPDYEPFSEDALATYIYQNYTACTDKPLLTYTTVKNNEAELHIREDVITQYYSSIEELNCCYSYVRRNGSVEEPDIGISKSNCTSFNSSINLTEDTVMVKCRDSYSTIVYENVHRPITIPIDIQNKTDKLIAKTSKPISVLFVVIDSVSRLNLIRTMNNTRNYLLENDFVELKGYNKINDNTFPNFIGFLTGYNLAESYGFCNPTMVNKLDDCKMIWYKYRDAGYATAYAEDWATLNTFNYYKKGFTNPPTDYYFKPYFEATDELLVQIKDTMPYCTGPETQGERTLNLAKDFALQFKDKPSFGIFWMNTFSHNYINSPTGMDHKIKEFYMELKNNGILDESVVIFLSDHGVRIGDIRKTRVGWFEERLPLNLISVPPWFREKFPSEYQNLKSNSEKLTSTFDLYMTLQHILVLSGVNHTIEESKACPKCSSLFSNLPTERSCTDAGIPHAWCTCIGYFSPENSTSPLVKSATDYTLPILNNNGYDFTSSLTISDVTASLSEAIGDTRYLLLVIYTQPEAKFLVLIKVNSRHHNDVLLNMVNIIRLYK